MTKLIVETEHFAFDACWSHIAVDDFTSLVFDPSQDKCVTCKRHCVKPSDQLLGQLPAERVTPASTFDKVGVDYANMVM